MEPGHSKLILIYNNNVVPYIGLYIEAGSLLCLVFMLFDVICALRHRQRWIPCRLFSLNSVTLTLLSISTKLQVDLTTFMPDNTDQLCKLTGSALICLSMGFFSPSLGNSRGSECYTNLVALSIMVVTIIVNTCLQMFSTHTISSYQVEHSTIMCCMFILLLLLWSSAWGINHSKKISLYSNRDIMIKGEGSMLQRLKLCYLHGFSSNPQLISCLEGSHSAVGGFSLLSSSVLMLAIFRSLHLFQECSWRNCLQYTFSNLHFGTSDYKWSIVIIVRTQALTVFIGGLAIAFRWMTMFSKRPGGDSHFWEDQTFKLIRNSPIMAPHRWDMCVFYLKNLIYLPLLLFSTIFLVIPTMLSRMTDSCCKHIYEDEEVVQEYKHLIVEQKIKFNAWMVWKAATDMNKWMEVSNSQPPKQLSKLLSRTHPSHHLDSTRLKDGVYPDKGGCQVSSLSMALLLKIAALSLPSHSFTKFLEDTFIEAYEVIDFIEARMDSVGLPDRMKSKLTKAVLFGEGFGVFLPKIIERSPYANEHEFASQSALERALVITKELKFTVHPYYLSQEVGAITDLINRREFETIEELYNYIEEIFVDMLHFFLALLPDVIFQEVTESSAEEFEKKVRFSSNCCVRWNP